MAENQILNNGQNANVGGAAPVYAGSVQPTTNPALASVQLDGLEDNQQKCTIRIGKTQYAIGMFWQPLQDVDDPIPEIRETMESDIGANLYTIHYGRSPQYGIGKTEKGHKEGQAAGAIAVLDALSDRSSFVAVFKVEEGWWFVAARNDLILPEEDILYRTEQEAKDAFYAMMAVPDWGYRIAPATWDIDDSEEIAVETLLKKGAQARLYSLSAIRGTKVLLTIAISLSALVGLAVYSVLLFIDKEQETPTFIEPIVPQTSMQTVEPEREDEKPWQKLVSVPDFLEKCWIDSYQLKAMQIPGWKLNRIVCTHDGISTGWNKTGEKATRVAWIETALKDQYKIKGDAQINTTGTSATLKIKFEDLPIASSAVATPTLSLAKLRRELVDISQALSMSIPLSEGQVVVAAPKPPEGSQGAQNAPQQASKVYKYLTFSFTSSMDPPAWEGFFKPFTGLEITKIEYNPTSDSALTNNWKYEGRIYESEKKN